MIVEACGYEREALERFLVNRLTNVNVVSKNPP